MLDSRPGIGDVDVRASAAVSTESQLPFAGVFRDTAIGLAERRFP